jgi:hypothetical protein
MSQWNAFAHWSVGAQPDTPPQEVLREAEQFLTLASQRHEATLVTLDNHFLMGWHPELGFFDIVQKRPDAPAHMPNFVARLTPEKRVHQGGASPEEALTALLNAYHTAKEEHGVDANTVART